MNDNTQERAAYHIHKVRMPYGPAIEAMQTVVDLANDTIPDPMYVIAASMALDALKREAAAVNSPLTLEELRGMEGKPVWVDMYGEWFVIFIAHPEYGDCALNRDGRWTPLYTLSRRRPYRRKPEGGGE